MGVKVFKPSTCVSEGLNSSRHVLGLNLGTCNCSFVAFYSKVAERKVTSSSPPETE